MVEWWLGRHSSSMRPGFCVELWSGHGESKSPSVVSVQNACFNVEAVIELEGFRVGPTRSHVALRNLRIERSKSRSSSSSSSSSEPFLPPDFELALVFDKPGQYTLPISDITRIRCKYLQQGKASLEARGSLVLLTAVTQGDLERLLLFIRDVKAGKTPVESRSCAVCREKNKVKHKRDELQSSVLDCIFRKRQLLHVSPGQDHVLKQLRDLKNRDHVHKSKKMGVAPGGSEDRAYVLNGEVNEPSSRTEDRFQDAMRHFSRENSGSRRSPPAYFSRGRDGQDSSSTSPTFTRVHFDERSRSTPDDVRRRERPGTWSGRRETGSLSPEGEKENFKGEEEVRKIGEETVRRVAEEKKRAEEEKRRVLEEQRRRADDEDRRVQEEQRRRREEMRRFEEEERRQVEEMERKSQDERRRREEKEELRKTVEEQERKRKEEKERRAMEDEKRRKEEEERLLQELRRQKQEEERLTKELERRVQEQEQLRKQEEERRRKEEEDQQLLELRRQKEEEERGKREHERRLQEQALELKRRQEEEKKKQEALRRQRQEEERLFQERRKQEELRRQKHDGSEEERRPRQDSSAGVKLQEDPKTRMLTEEERKKLESRRRAFEEKREKLEQRRLEEEMRQWQREEDQRRAKEDMWNMPDEERTRLEEQRHRVEEVMKMTRDLARKRMEETVKEEERRRQAQEEQDEEFCRKFLDEDKRSLDEDIQKLVDKANNVASLEEVLIKLRERCSFRREMLASDNAENVSPTSDRSKGMSYLFTRLEEQERIRKGEARLNVKLDNSADFEAKAEKQKQEELKRHEVERKRAEKTANALKKKLLQEQLRAAKLEARRLERARKEAEKRAKAEERAKQQQKAQEQARKQAQEQAKQHRFPSAPQRWPSYNHRPLTYHEYEESWNVMKLSRKGSSLGYADIPWPPAGNPLFIESGDSLDVQRRKLRIALLRWHPDKFMALCGERLGSKDRESIETQANHLAQQVILWKSKLEQA